MWDLLLLGKAAVMGVVEGLTEFLPISSTGHLILTGSLIDFTSEKAKVFEIVIQFAAILAVVMNYKVRVVSTLKGLGKDPVANRFTLNLFLAFLPAAVLGLIFAHKIKEYLFSPLPVALAFIGGGFAILWIERRVASPEHAPRVQAVDEMHWSDALKVGFAQCLALIPGMSRSGSTIMGALWFGMSRMAATEFSFLLAMPVIFAATAYELFKSRDLLSMADLPLFAVGSVFSFISAFVCVRWLLRYVAQHDFRLFAWYRIAFGVLVLLTAQMGWISWA
ncbi:undecaprenyl-diphosphate phosphatase [Limnobacter litoralis]|uniref:Undecaprenyl-diphosphatase n=1 Tax=Limnobacter litoralis TaxID=481366 RepID=A0ABQ5YK96_9BURK|nr:undecaprenyl-diphosphate phosphatase [Limnobacter litoralis]GLR24950.1 undecaprenyl-diphosphatase 2 [Limnobacter litoralis]